MGAVARVTKVTMPAPSTAWATEDASSTFSPSALPGAPDELRPARRRRG